MREPDSVTQLRILVARRAWLDMAIEQRGDPRGHYMRESAALTWALELLESYGHADEVEQARELVAKRPPWIPR